MFSALKFWVKDISAIKPLEEIGPFGENLTLFISKGFENEKQLKQYFSISIFTIERAFQRFIICTNTRIETDSVSKVQFCPFDFWAKFSRMMS